MANRSFKDLATLANGVVALAGNITLTPQALTGTTARNFPGASGSMVSAGLYRVTTTDPYVSLLSHTCALEHTGSQNYRVELSGSVFGSTSSYHDFRVMSGSTATKPSSDGAKLHISLFLKNSRV